MPVAEKGFTLAELMVSLTLMLIVLLGAYQFMVSSARLYKSEDETLAMDQQARVAIDVIVRALRQSGSDPMQSAFDASVTDSLAIPVAKRYAVRILADLPQDTMDDDGNPEPDGDTFDIHDDGDGVWGDDENENGDGMVLPTNADPDEDVTFLLSPCDSSLQPTGSGPWTLIKRVRDGSGGFTDQPLASNLITKNGNPGLEFRYALRHQAGEANVDTIPVSFATRWTGASGTGVALNSSTYTNLLDRKLINRVLVRLTLRSANPDRDTKLYNHITLESDVDLRTRP
jgi:prepilin-type N-terminal cleavage/methylation domain-containing protein